MIEYLETERLILRKAEDKDLDSIWQRVWKNETLSEMMLWTPTLTYDEAKERLERTKAYQAQYHAFFVCLKENDEPIGFAGVREPQPGEFEESGVCIAKEYQKQGYGKEVLHALIGLVFDRLNGSRFLCSCFHENTASAALIRSCGFHYLKSEYQLRERDGYRFLCDTYELKR